jgi:hypothetical protein
MTKVPCIVVVLILQERCRNGPEIGECFKSGPKVDREEGATFHEYTLLYSTHDKSYTRNKNCQSFTQALCTD